MKTLGFAEITTVPLETGDVALRITSPQGDLEVIMSNDELMMFLVEIGNGLAKGREREIELQVEAAVERERRRSL